MDAQVVLRSVLNDSLEGYEVALVAIPRLPAWAAMLGAEPVDMHASADNRQWILVRSDR
jgi:hypothetical protein